MQLNCYHWKVFIVINAFYFLNAFSLTSDNNLYFFNKGLNKFFKNKLVDDAVVINVHLNDKKIPASGNNFTLFGFFIHGFIHQKFSVSVDYDQRLLVLNLKTLFTEFNVNFSMPNLNSDLKSLSLKLNDEENIVDIEVNCNIKGSLKTPINLIKYFRSVYKHRYNILFNKYYTFTVYEEDEELPKSLNCYFRDAILNQYEDGFLLNIANNLRTNVAEDVILLSKFNETHSPAAEVFIKAFLFKDLKLSNKQLQKSVRLTQEVMKNVGVVFKKLLQNLLYKIFSSYDAEPKYVRKNKQNYFDNKYIKDRVLSILFKKSTNLYIDAMRTEAEIGKLFRNTFVNANIPINGIMKNSSVLKEHLLDIIFKYPLDQFAETRLNPPHAIVLGFIHYFLIDESANQSDVIELYKDLIFSASDTEYEIIGQFVRHVFIKPTGMSIARKYLQTDYNIGKNIVKLALQGKLTSKNLPTKIRKAVVLPDLDDDVAPLAEENSKLIRTLTETFIDKNEIRFVMASVFENMIGYHYVTYNHIDEESGDIIYKYLKTLFTTDLQKDHSLVKEYLSRKNLLQYIHSFIGSLYKTVLDDAGKSDKFKNIAKEFVQNALNQSNQNDVTLVSDDEYVRLFRVLLGKNGNSSEEISNAQRIRDFKALLISAKGIGGSQSELVDEAASVSKLLLTSSQILEIKTLFSNSNDTVTHLSEQLDIILDDTSKQDQDHFNALNMTELKEGVTFYPEKEDTEQEEIFWKNGNKQELKIVQVSKVTPSVNMGASHEENKNFDNSFDTRFERIESVYVEKPSKK